MLSTLALSLALSGAPQTAEPHPLLRLNTLVPPITDTHRENVVEFVDRGATDDLGWTSPVVELAARADMRWTSVSVAFGWTWIRDDSSRRPVWFARLRARHNRGTIERFADSRECPAVQEALDRIAGLPTLRPRVPALPDPSGPASDVDFGGGYLHDNTYRLRMRALFEGARYSDRIDITANSGSPIAPLTGEVLAALMPCWTETAPPRE
ncbi:hypothetical protein GCM10009422_06610 [Brevundimonas kwangchunensis]|uniref:DUF4136 domain-containing protein n=1 Tax=Brevundimonas kwangchunensis TaxID=322163 RepID=A0ABN1GM24_9CAUL